MARAQPRVPARSQVSKWKDLEPGHARVQPPDVPACLGRREK